MESRASGSSLERDRLPGRTSFDEFNAGDYVIDGGRFSRGDEFVEVMGLRVTGVPASARMRARALRLDAYSIAYVSTTPMTFVWSRVEPAARSRYMYLFVDHGDVEIRGSGAVSSAPSGGIAVVLPGGDEVTITASTSAQMIFFIFDESQVQPLSLSGRGLAALPAHSPVFRASYTCLAGVVQTEATAGAGSVNVLRELTREVARALMLESSHDRRHTDIADHALQLIDRRYRTPHFSPTELAQELGVSRRTVDRALAGRDTTAAGEIRNRRSRHAYDLIVSQPRTDMSAIAAESGFASTTLLRRAILSQYGVTPAALRQPGRETAGSAR